MSNIKALIVGVSDYYIEGASNLPFCKNDILMMEEALLNGLKLSQNDIIVYGSSGEVKKKDFLDALTNLSDITNVDDTFIFYFSGHGTTIEKSHYLVFSDGLLSTQSIINYFQSVQVKSKLIFLDCCYSGNFKIDKSSSTFDIVGTVNDFYGKGYAVFASSNSSQKSYGNPQNQLSVFTSFLCDALQDKYIIKQGKLALYDIHKLVSLYLELWNRDNPKMQQQLIFRANMGGTVFFQVEDYEPFCKTKVYQENDKYIIYDVDPKHTGSIKRYSVGVILKEPFSLAEIGEISKEIKDTIKTVEVYDHAASKSRWYGKLANIIWIYFGRDETDMLKNNYICRTTWVDNKQDKNLWYEVNNKDKFIMNGVCFRIHSYYKNLKIFNEKNTGNKDELIFQMKEILSNMITVAEEVIFNFNEYRNKTISEEEFVHIMKKINPSLNKYYFLSTDLDIAPDEIHDWDQACTQIFNTIHEFTHFYSKRGLEQRTPKNRMECMEMTIKKYYLNLEKIREKEKQIGV